MEWNDGRADSFTAGSVRGLIERPANGGLVPTGLPGHVEGIALPYDPIAARRSPADGGFPEGHNFPDVTVKSIRRFSPFVNSAYLRQQWLENLGISVGDELLSLKEFSDGFGFSSEEGGSQLWLCPWLGSNDLEGFSPVIESTGWRNDAYSQLIERARESMNQQERLALYGRAERILVEESPVVPVFYYRRQLLLKPWVKRFPMSPSRQWFWQEVIIEPHD